jgi:uncharacterized protein YndB with AHSA1/START domain
MTTDLTTPIGVVTRVVESCQHDGRAARKVIATRTYETVPDDLWDALTNETRISRWFLPVSGDLRLGGRYQLEGNAGGTITHCDPPTRLSLTWEYGGEVSWVTVTLAAEQGERTHLTLEHVAHVDDARWDQYGPGAVGVGWDLTLLGLAWHLESGGTIGSKQGMAWLGTPEGKDFVRRTSDDWGRASIDSGTDATAARAAAERTRAAYTGDVTAPEA